MKKRKRRNLRGIVVNQSTLVRILVFLLVILVGLIIVYVSIYEPRTVEEDLKGELGTLCIFCEENKVDLEVLNYLIYNNNDSLDVNINWSGGNVPDEDFNSILLDLDMRVGPNCNLTISSDLGLPIFSENKTYSLYGGDFNTGCVELDFSNVTSVSAYAEINIHLTQTTIPIPEVNFYKDDSRTNLINFDKYFNALVEVNYSVIESPDNSQIEVFVNNNTKNLSITVLDGSWFGTQQFNLTAITKEGDELNTLTSGNNMSFNIIVLNEARPVVASNEAPEFDFEDCETISWVENTNKTIDMDYCWDDGDDDDLIYEYGDLNNYEENISITRLSGNRLKFAPDIGFNGSTYLRFYANDSTVRVSQRVDIVVLAASINISSDDSGYDNSDEGVLEIKSSSPSSSKISFSINENKKFVIVAENYENIEWYVGEELKKEGSLSYTFEETIPGDYLIKVKIINGTEIDSKIWEVTIEERGVVSGKDILDVDIGQVVFYLIVSVLVIIILLVIWLFIVEKNKKNKKVNLGFGVSVVPNRHGKNSSSNQFNIPKE